MSPEHLDTENQIDSQTLLFGCDNTECIVSVEPTDDRAVIYIRDSSGIRVEEDKFIPWLISPEKYDISGASWTELEGDHYYRFLAEFPNWNAFMAARFSLKDQHLSHHAQPTPVRHYLIRSGKTMFKGMSFSDVHRMQIDIETLGFSPESSENEIFLISAADNRGFKTLIEGDEKEILQSLVNLIRELDPDVIEGHNIFSFDLPYIAKRAEMHGIKLAIGRDGSEIIRGKNQSVAIGGTSRTTTTFHVYGRHLIDTLIGVQRYDAAKGSLASYGLKEAAKMLGVSEEDRVLINHNEIANTWRTDPDKVRTYALQDAVETRSLSELISQSEFYLTQMIPDSYENVAVSGNGEKINLLMFREYLRRGHSIPQAQQNAEFPGGYTEVRITGLVERVVKCDVESLYPSLMLTYRIKPESDTLNVFLPMLEELTKRRIEAKSKAKSSTDAEREYWDGLQSSFKILINSFYGYLGAPLNFNDPAAAEKVTTTGQAIVKKIAEELERTESKVIEIDTDGVYFQPPPNITTEEDEIKYITQVGSVLPKGIRLAHDGRYKAMLSLKIKNYVLVTYDGEKIFKGSAVRSRADEMFGREFISKAVDYLIQGEKDKVAELYAQMRSDIEKKRMPVEMFARRERITEKTFTSEAKAKLAEAAKGAQVGEFVTVYRKEDGSLELAENYNGDEDTKHLLDKLYKFACRLKEAFDSDFDRLFPKPSPKTEAEAAGQQTLF